MKIGIDARIFGVKEAGLGRYAQELVGNLARFDRKNQYALFVRKKTKKQLTINQLGNLAVIEANFSHYSLLEQILMPPFLYRAKCDLVHFLHFNVPIFYFRPYVVTIHDLIKHESKGLATTTRNPILYWLKYLGYLLVVWLAAKRAKKVIVPSRWVKEKVVRQFGLERNKVVVIYEGVSENIKYQISNIKYQKEVLEKYKIKKPYLLYVGSVYPHKNVERLIEAVRTVNQSSITLVIVCARSVFWERLKRKINQMKARGFVKLIGFVPENDLPVLYQSAHAFVFPSLSEGFGLPGLEAMACGTPVICSDIPVFREIYGESAVYFDPYRVDDIARRILEVLHYDAMTHHSRVEEGKRWVKKFSWEKCAKETLKVYEGLESRI